MKFISSDLLSDFIVIDVVTKNASELHSFNNVLRRFFEDLIYKFKEGVRSHIILRLNIYSKGNGFGIGYKCINYWVNWFYFVKGFKIDNGPYHKIGNNLYVLLSDFRTSIHTIHFTLIGNLIHSIFEHDFEEFVSNVEKVLESDEVIKVLYAQSLKLNEVVSNINVFENRIFELVKIVVNVYKNLNVDDEFIRLRELKQKILSVLGNEHYEVDKSFNVVVPKKTFVELRKLLRSTLGSDVKYMFFSNEKKEKYVITLSSLYNINALGIDFTKFEKIKNRLEKLKILIKIVKTLGIVRALIN